MKTTHIITMALLVISAPVSRASESKNTAEHIIASSPEFEGKEVKLDISFVKPVKWKSPIPEIAFFHAVTIDRRDQKMGGSILVAVNAADAAAFARKYGMDFDGRRDSDPLRGVFLAAPGRGSIPKARARIWFIDTTGSAAELVKNNRLELEEDGSEANKEGRADARRKVSKVE